jgi:hypothetical protein
VGWVGRASGTSVSSWTQMEGAMVILYKLYLRWFTRNGRSKNAIWGLTYCLANPNINSMIKYILSLVRKEGEWIFGEKNPSYHAWSNYKIWKFSHINRNNVQMNSFLIIRWSNFKQRGSTPLWLCIETCLCHDLLIPPPLIHFGYPSAIKQQEENWLEEADHCP